MIEDLFTHVPNLNLMTEEDIHAYECPYKAILGSFNRLEHIVEDQDGSELIDLEPGFFGAPRPVKDVCRYDLVRPYRRHLEMVSSLSASLYSSIKELRRVHSRKLPMSGLGKTNWHYSISYRKPGVYLRVLKGLDH